MIILLIIIEAPDGAGKSTLAQRLLVRITATHPDDVVELIHRGPPHENLIDEYETPLRNYQPGQGRHIICDRWHLGEAVYPKILGRTSTLTPAIWDHIETFLNARGVLLVVLDIGLDTLKSRIRERGDDLVHEAQLADIVSGYHQVMYKTQLPACIFTDTDLTPNLDNIIDSARMHEMYTTDVGRL